MIPIELELSNFLAYKDSQSLSFDGIHVACLVGPNGAGKSSLLDAITWALWGKARTSTPDDLIHHGQEHMRVTLVFQQDQFRYRVIRQRKAGDRGQSLLELQQLDEAGISWEGISAPTMRETQQGIINLIRLDYDTFVNSALLLQGRADEFTTRTPGERKQVLASILGLNEWERLELRAKDRVQIKKEEFVRIDTRTADILSELAQREEAAQEVEHAVTQAEETARALHEAETAWAKQEEARNRWKELIEEREDCGRRMIAVEEERSEHVRALEGLRPRADKARLEAEVGALKSKLEILKDKRNRYDAATAEKNRMDTDRAHLLGINNALGPETDPIKERIHVLETTVEPACPTCGQALTDRHRRDVIADLAAEIETRREQYRLNRDLIKGLERKLQVVGRECQDLERELSAQMNLEKRAGEVEAALQHVADVDALIKQREEQLLRLHSALQEVRDRMSRLDQDIDETASLLDGDLHSAQVLDRLRLDNRLADERVGGARQKLAALDALEGQLEALRLRGKKLSMEIEMYEMLRAAFGKRGVPAMLIESVVPELEQEANKLLRRMTDGRMDVRIETQREIKTGETREALDIIISDELGSRPYETFSGGEAFRINFSLRIALSKLLANRAGARLKTLFIDEGFGTQDASGRAYLIAAIQSIQEDFEQILVITHIDELKDAFPARIEVEKSPQGARLRLS
ncbi:MAG: SMC family ATPase [Anaerolineales bacterium]|nr:SMC family ATPase [Anaerolineales bacterium]